VSSDVEIEYADDEAGEEGLPEGIEGVVLQRRRQVRQEIRERLVSLPAKMMESKDPAMVQEGTALYMLMQEESFYGQTKAR